MKKAKILIADDDNIFCELTKFILTEHQYTVYLTYDSQSTLDFINHHDCDLILLDLHFPDFQTGLTTLKAIKEKAKNTPVIIITSDNMSLRTRFPDLIQNGSFDIIEKPLQEERLLLTIRNTIKYSHLEKNSTHKNSDFIYLIGNSSQIIKTKHQIANTLQTENHLIIYGDAGTGITNIAKKIHLASSRSNKPLHRLDCRKMSLKDMQIALFGNPNEKNIEKKFRDIKIVQAENSILMIENVHLMPEKIQAKLVRTLTGRKLNSLGGKSLEDINVKLIFTTKKEYYNCICSSSICSLLLELCQDKLVIPSLNERVEDIPLVIDHFINKYNQTTDSNITITDSAVKVLMKHNWEDNITGLKRVVLRILHQIDTEQITNRDISFQVDQVDTFVPQPYKQAIKNYEKKYLVQVMEYKDWNLSDAAQLLNIDRSNLFKKLQNHGIKIKKHL